MDVRTARRICWVAVTVTVLSCLPAGLCRADLSRCIDATCRISMADGSRGTGCAFEKSQGRIFVLTAAHVVGSNRSVRCEFWRDGHQSAPLPGEVIVRSESVDAAIVAIPESMFGGLLPRVVPLAPRDYAVRPGQTVTSVGCANGSWSTGWKGHALRYQGMDLHFVPTPADGRSGSAVFDAGGEMIVALLRARTLDGSQGIATSLPALYRALTPNRSAVSDTFGPNRLVPVQCGPGGCESAQPRWRLLPYRFNQQFPDSPPQLPQPSPWRASPESTSPWPTLPAQPQPNLVPSPPIPLAPTVAIDIDMKPLAEALRGDPQLDKARLELLQLQVEQTRRQVAKVAERETEERLTPLIAPATEAVGQLIQGEFTGAADAVFTSGSVWEIVWQVLWSFAAPVLGFGAVGLGAGRLIGRFFARSFGPTGYKAARDAIVDWWKDDEDSPNEAKAKDQMAEKIAAKTVDKINGNLDKATK